MAKKSTFRLFGKEIAIAKSNAKTMKKSSTKKGKCLKLFGVEIPVPKAPRKSMAKRQRRLREEVDAASPLPLPREALQFLASQKGAVPVFFARKELEESDVNFNLNRLFIPKTRELLNLLNEEERAILEKSGKDGRLGVTVVGPMGELYSMCLNLWPSLNKFVLIKEWVQLVKNYELKADHDENGHSVELWHFRGEDSKLGFAINILKDKQSIIPGDINGDAGTSSSHNSSAITHVN